MTSILIVENDSDLRTTLKRYFTMCGYAVLTAEEGRQALDVMRGSLIHLVITDLVMEGMDGIELIKILHADHPRIKIIAISGGGSQPPTAYLAAARALGAHACLEKPLSIPDLVQTVRILVSLNASISSDSQRALHPSGVKS